MRGNVENQAKIPHHRYARARNRGAIVHERQVQAKELLSKEKGDLRNALVKRREEKGVDPKTFPEYEVSDDETRYERDEFTEYKREVVDYDEQIKYEATDENENDNGDTPPNEVGIGASDSGAGADQSPTTGAGAASLGVAMAMAKYYAPAIGVTKIGEDNNQEFLVKHVTPVRKGTSIHIRELELRLCQSFRPLMCALK